MSEVYKITNMLVTDEDIKHIDKNWQSIIDEYTKTLVREKDLVITQYLMKKQKEEIERLKNINEEHRILNGELRKELQEKENIIKEAREYIKKHGDYNKLSGCIEELDLYKINELLDILKGSDKE